jgi:carbon storage regulator CsrA
MLVISRRINERVRIGEEVWVSIVDLVGGKVKLGIDAPRHVSIMREELLKGEGLPPDYRPGRRETVRPDSDLARAQPLQPERPSEEDDHE